MLRLKLMEARPQSYQTRFTSPALAESLANIPRTGWKQWEVEVPETVWEHVLATRSLALEYKDALGLSEVQFQDLLDLLEIHDWSESLTGDWVVLGDEPEAAQRQHDQAAAEAAAMTKLCADHPKGDAVMALFQRFVSGSDEVARLAYELEQFQAILKAREYEQNQGKTGITAEFIHYTKDKITHPFLVRKLLAIEAALPSE